MRTRVATRPTATFLRAGQDVRGSAESVLQRSVGVADHQRVEAGAGHHREVLAVDLADVETPPVAVQADRDRGADVLRYLEVRREQVRGAGRDDRERDVGAGHRVDAALHHAVAAPHEDQVGAGGERLADALRRHLRLRHLEPQRIDDAGGRQLVAQLAQAAAERFPGVCHHCNAAHDSSHLGLVQRARNRRWRLLVERHERPRSLGSGTGTRPAPLLTGMAQLPG